MTQAGHPIVCADCGGPLEAVALFGRGPQNPLTGVAIDAALQYYTDAGANRTSLWWGAGMLTAKGTVQASMCTSCRRIFLYGIPG
jgi:hypothetical protein